jgi:TPP-dependent pyruvate/acetoin dehydrogenase alpha subunit
MRSHAMCDPDRFKSEDVQCGSDVVGGDTPVSTGGACVVQRIRQREQIAVCVVAEGRVAPQRIGHRVTQVDP